MISSIFIYKSNWFLILNYYSMKYHPIQFDTEVWRYWRLFKITFLKIKAFWSFLFLWKQFFPSFTIHIINYCIYPSGGMFVNLTQWSSIFWIVCIANWQIIIYFCLCLAYYWNFYKWSNSFKLQGKILTSKHIYITSIFGNLRFFLFIINSNNLWH